MAGNRGFKVAARSAADIRRIAQRVRDIGSSVMGDADYFDVMRFTELLYDRGQLVLEVVENHALGKDQALSIPSERRITLPERVYEGAYDGNARDRFTVAHEFGHIALSHAPRFSRTTARREHEPFEDSEWQADCFAAELLMDSRRMTSRDTLFTIMRRFGVSQAAARLRATASCRP